MSDCLPGLLVLGKKLVRELIDNNIDYVFHLIKKAYSLTRTEQVVNPPSYFLRFPEKPNSRIIALPSYIGADVDKAGLKWISSFPDNIEKGIERASAVCILNDGQNGLPIACFEASYISAIRTALSAILAAKLILNRKKVSKISFIGAGYISQTILQSFWKMGWEFENVAIYDLDRNRAENFANQLNHLCTISASFDLKNTLKTSDIIVFATTALKPYIDDYRCFEHNPTVLHVSLRDLDVSIIKNAINYVDSSEHILAANTSLHLTYQEAGHDNFIHGTIGQLLSDRTMVPTPSDKPIIFSPMGMGILDLIITNFLFYAARKENLGCYVDDFFVG